MPRAEVAKCSQRDGCQNCRHNLEARPNPPIYRYFKKKIKKKKKREREMESCERRGNYRISKKLAYRAIKKNGELREREKERNWERETVAVKVKPNKPSPIIIIFSLPFSPSDAFSDRYFSAAGAVGPLLPGDSPLVMKNTNHKPKNNGFIPNSLRFISSCIKTASTGVRSAGASVAASISGDPDERKDQVIILFLFCWFCIVPLDFDDLLDWVGLCLVVDSTKEMIVFVLLLLLLLFWDIDCFGI